MLPRRPGGKARSRALRELAAEQLGLTIQAPPPLLPPFPLFLHLGVGNGTSVYMYQSAVRTGNVARKLPKSRKLS